MKKIFPYLQIQTHKEFNSLDPLKGKQEIFHVEVTTSVRKLQQEKWYLCNVVEKGMIRFPDETSVLQLIHQCVVRCNTAAYKFLLFGVIDPELEELTGKIFEIDPDQRSEAERLNVIPYTIT